MLVLLKPGATADQVCQVRETASAMGLSGEEIAFGDRRAVRLVGVGLRPPTGAFGLLPQVDQVLPFGRSLRLAAGRRDVEPVKVGPWTAGRGGLLLIAGPCAVESEEQLFPLVDRLRRAGVGLLRGGAYKPRSSPYDFQGLGEEGLRLLARARERSGLPVVTEALDERSLELVQRYADVIQIGARNMHNFSLLQRAGSSRLPVLLKRGFSATLEDLLLAAEYVLERGNPNVLLCERGIRTFSDHSRFTLDLSLVPRIRQLSHLPIVVDPRHAAGIHDSVAPLARAAVAVGAEGVMIEVHPDPTRALSDGPQSLTPAEFEVLAAELRALAPSIARQRETVP